MCQHVHDPRRCILPPHLLRSIAEKGTPGQRQAALDTLSTDNTFRALRAAAVVQPAGAIVPAAQPAPNKVINVYDAGSTQTLPGTLRRANGAGPVGDAATDEAYDGLDKTFDHFWQVFGRNSLDDEGLPLDATVHFGSSYNNAFWDGSRMVFGDGDGALFNRFTVALDVIAHELGHGVTEDEAGLVYFYQPGALNEHFSDVFGSLVKQWTLNQTAGAADWLIGAGLLGSTVNGVALRSMKAPGTAYDDPVLGKDPQPAHMSKFVTTWQDNGGVHINSGIPNHAFYCLASSLGGYSWDKAGRIWYETLRDSRLRQNSGFLRFARLTHSTAQRLHGPTSSEAGAVKHAWDVVGISI